MDRRAWLLDNAKKLQRSRRGMMWGEEFCLMNLGKLILVLREVFDWTITFFFLSFFVVDMANPEMA